MFATTGLTIVGTRFYHMTPSMATEFYGFLEGVFQKKFRPRVGERLRNRLTGAFDFPITDEEYKEMCQHVTPRYAKNEVQKIMDYMTSGPALGLLYRGPNCIATVREKLGSTNPAEASTGTIRALFGHDVMRNGAHASDAPESADRERKIVGLVGNEPSAEKALIEHFLKHMPK